MRRKIAKPLLLTASFTLLLTSVFYLAHDTVLSNSRIIGWQAYTSIDLRKSSSPSTSSSPQSSVTSISPSSEQYDDIFPLDLYAPLLPNPSPLTEITVHSCLPLASCSPKTTPAEDALLGKWVKVDRSLSPTGQYGASAGGMLGNLFGSIEQRYIFYRRSRRRDVRNVVELKLVEEGETPPTPGGDEGWHRIKTGLRSKTVRLISGEKALHLYYRTVSPAQRQAQSSGLWKRKAAEAVTELDLVYGNNPPWPGFESAGLVSQEHSSIGAAQVSLSFRRNPMRKPPLSPLKFKQDGSFKILQLADLHFSVNPEPCRDYNPKDPRWATRGCLSKNDTFSLIDNWLDTEKPDLVVLTGDQLNGQGTSWDPRSVLSLYTAPLIARKIPYAVILGNHDSESGPLTRGEQMQIISQMPYSYSQVGPAMVTGEGNYLLKIESGREDRTHVASLWFMDTGARAERDKWKPWTKPGYDYVHKDQIEWFEKHYTDIKQVLLPYKPDGAKDLPQQNWKRARRASARQLSDATGDSSRRDVTWDAAADQNQALARPPSIVFMHIPIPEAFNPVDTSPSPLSVSNPTNTSISRTTMAVGDRKETATFEGAQSQPGIFDLFTQLNTHALPDVGGAGNIAGVKLVVHGHMHLNSDCRRVNNVWICFGGGSSLAGYGNAKVERRARVIVLEEWGGRIRTYHRISSKDAGETGKRFDDFVLPFSWLDTHTRMKGEQG
ncbi:related to DCR2-dosage-dependent cell cycle regulator [Ustilago bromivora]|uniref:Related to DCR2-dosage-dependent cell cycle regulator n=1 Tax=Ustilago bromivora TaxID=307758 RepID=A0A1K0H6R7_9BASI|nr:related to DCR2-dosage-dependent cell cycle regulator [Ustilago bromivora]